MGSQEPERDVQQQVVLVGHHDSPFIFTFLERCQGIAFIRFLLAMLVYAWLCGYSVVACIAGYSGVLQAPDGTPLQHTRLVFLSTDGEEIGQRGAIEFVRSHRHELGSLPTRVLNIDSVYRERDLTVLTRDRNGTCRLSGAMVADVLAVAGGLGHRLKRKPIPFGGDGRADGSR